MKREDDIEKFFEKRLRNVTEGEDGWNIPSDDIWDKARVHFPAKPKKRKPLIFFWLGIGSLLLLVGVLWGINIQEKTKNAVNPTQKIAKQENAASKEESAILPVQEIKQPESENDITNSKALEISNETEIPKNRETFKTQNNIKAIPKSTAFLNSTSVDNSSSGSTKIAQYKNVEEGMMVEKMRSQTEEQLQKPIQVFEKESAPSMFLGLPLIKDSPKMEGKRYPEFPTTAIKSTRPLHKWEVGISHSPWYINLNNLFDDDSLGVNETLTADLNYFSLNIPVTRRLSPRFSLSSGIMYSKIDVGINFSVDEAYEEVENDVQLRQLFSNNFTNGSLLINDQAQEIDIEFIQGVNLNNGDVLNFQGNIPIDLSVIQLPLILNYHIGRGRLEGLLHGGFSVDRYTYAIKELDIKIYKESQLISKPIVFDALQGGDFGFSIFAGAGLKYHLNDKLNIGLSGKLDLTELLFSRSEIGLYYGF